MKEKNVAKIINPLEEKSVVHDRPDSRRMMLYQHKEVERLKRNARYTRVTEYDFGAGAKHRRFKNLEGFREDAEDD